MIKKLIVLHLLIGSLIGCDDNSEKNPDELVCTDYYLEELNDSFGLTTKFYYNPNGQLKSFIIDNYEGFQFNYTDNRVTSITGINLFFECKLQYDNQNRLIAFVRNSGSTPTDSMSLEYDASNRIVKQSYFTGASLQLNYYTIAEYTGMNTTALNFYQQLPAGSGNFQYKDTFYYTYDNNKKPEPPEYSLLDMYAGNVISENNVVTIQINSENPELPTIYKYNSGGYPIKEKRGSSEVSYTYSCVPIME